MPWGKAIAGMLMLLGSALGAGSPRGTAPAPYTIIDLGTLGGWSSVALGINNRGQVVGGADRADGLRHPFLWTDGGMIDLGTLRPGRHAEAWDINNVGQVIGVLGVGSGGFLWEDGQMINLGHLTGASSGGTSALAINDAGQVVGISGLSTTESHAFLWENGVMTDLGTLGGTYSLARDINALGQVVGTSSTGGLPGGAFLWQNGVMTNLGTLGGGGSEAFGINDLGQIVGWALRSGENKFFSAFLWENGEMTDLGALVGFPSSRAFAINNCGQILLTPLLLYNSVDEVMHAMSDLIPPDSGWFYLDARDINDAGQIVGAGTFNGARRAFLMLPNEGDADEDGVPDCLDECPGVDDSRFAPDCEDAIPTLSGWGLIIFVVSFLVAAKVYFGWQSTPDR